MGVGFSQTGEVTGELCKATTRAGDRCRRRAVSNGACEIGAHRDQVAGKGNVGRRHAKKHEVQCVACQHPELKQIDAQWTNWALSDAEAAERVGCSQRAWQRHASYTGLYEKRAMAILPYCTRAMERALQAKPTASSGVAAAALAFKVYSGGERIILETSERVREELFAALDAADLTDEQLEALEGALTADA
jgi:hypothetical protein